MGPSLDLPRTGKSISIALAFALRACVRACEAVCARETMLFPMLGRGSSKNPPRSCGVARRVPFGCLLVS